MQPWLKLAALVLVIAALGLPVNDLFRYALLVVATVAVVAGTVAARPAPWLGATAAVALCVLGQILFPAPRIEEGHNVFLVDRAGGVLEAGLPRAAFARMAAEFDRRVVEHVRRGDLAAVAALDESLVADAKADSWWQMLILHGALGEGWQADLLSYEVPTYFGMLCAAFSPG